MKRLPAPALVALKLLIAAGLIALVLSTTDLSEVLERLGHLSAGALVTAVALVLLWTAFNSLRWNLVLRGLGHPIPPGMAWSLAMAGLFFSQFLPSTVGGDAVRIGLATRRGIPLGISFGSTVTDRAVTLLFIALVLLLAAPLTAERLHDWRLANAILAAAVVVSVGGLLPLLPINWRRVMPRLLQPLGAVIEHYRFTLLHSRQRPALVVLCAIAYLIPCAIFYVFARDLHLPLSLLDCLLLVPPVILAMAVPVSFAGWGVREVSATALFGAVGIATTDSLVMSVAFGATSAVAGLVGGVVWQLSGGRRAAGGAAIPGAEAAGGRAPSR